MFGALFFRGYMLRAFYFTGSGGASSADDGWLPIYIRRRHRGR